MSQRHNNGARECNPKPRALNTFLLVSMRAISRLMNNRFLLVLFELDLRHFNSLALFNNLSADVMTMLLTRIIQNFSLSYTFLSET